MKIELYICKLFFIIFFLPLFYVIWLIDCMYTWEVFTFLLVAFAGLFCTRIIEFYIKTGHSLFNKNVE